MEIYNITALVVTLCTLVVVKHLFTTVRQSISNYGESGGYLALYLLFGGFMGKVAEQVMTLVQPIAESFGLEVLEVLYEKKYDGMNLTVVIDKDCGVTIDDCEKLHRAIDEPLDKLDPIESEYILNVSSPGLDRPLKLERDYKRNLNKKILVKLYTPLDNKKSYEGILFDYDSQTFSIKLQNGEAIKFNKKDTAKVEPIIEF